MRVLFTSRTFAIYVSESRITTEKVQINFIEISPLVTIFGLQYSRKIIFFKVYYFSVFSIQFGIGRKVEIDSTVLSRLMDEVEDLLKQVADQNYEAALATAANLQHAQTGRYIYLQYLFYHFLSPCAWTMVYPSKIYKVLVFRLSVFEYKKLGF